MDLISRISQQFSDSAHTKLEAIELLAAPIAGAVEVMVGSLVGNGRILACGNGGSAADAQHFAAELVGRFEMERQGLAAIALTTDSSILTAVSNDYGFKAIFERQVRALGQPGDVLLAISTSGNSPNVLRAADAARARGMQVIAFTGRSGGKLFALSDSCFRMPSDETPRIQEGHEFIGHLLCSLIESGMFPRDGD